MAGTRKTDLDRARGLEPIEVSSTDAQNRFGHYLREATRDRPVIITRRDERQAVLLSFDRYRQLMGEGSPALEKLRERFDTMFDRMQTTDAKTAVQRTYSFSSEEMGAAAVAAAQHRNKKGP